MDSQHCYTFLMGLDAERIIRMDGQDAQEETSGEITEPFKKKSVCEEFSIHTIQVSVHL